MSDPETPTEQFTKDLKRLGTTFGRDIRGELLAEFYRVFGGMEPEKFATLIDWSIRNLDAPFPSIARLRKGAVGLGFLKADAKADTNDTRVPKAKDFPFVYVVCPRCEETFVVLKSKLAEYARQDAVFVCVNQMHWGCPMIFRARDIEEGELRTQNSEFGPPQTARVR